MSDRSDSTAAAPPAWANRMMVLFLHTPILQRFIGRSVALVTFTGRTTGRTYTIPVSYEREGDRLMMLSRASRRWWRNLRGGVPVRVRLAGALHRGVAAAGVCRTDDLEDVRTFLSRRPIDARAYGLTIDGDGRVDETAIRSLLPTLAVVRIELSTPTGGRPTG